MPVSRSAASRYRLLLVLAGALAAAALFAGGTLVGRATEDERDPGSSVGGTRDAQSAPDAPKTGSASPAIAVAKGGEGGTNGGAAYSGMPIDGSPAGCEAPVGDILSGSVIDPGKQGFAPRLPGAGWSLVSVSLRAAGPCEGGGTAADSKLVMDTSWLHVATGLGAHVSQAVSPEREPNVLATTYASFWDGGYQFRVDVNGFRIMPAGAVTSANGVVKPAIAPVPADDPRSREVLEALVMALQPKGGLQCFYREAPGAWEDLAKLGIGDPRPAVPAGLTLQELRVTTFTAPAPGCDVAPGKPAGTGFNAVWTQDQSRGAFGVLYVSAYARTPEMGRYPGHVTEYSASWSNASYQFSVGMKSEKPLGGTKIREIAKLLDPDFERACFSVERQLSGGDLATYGLRKPKAPAGLNIVNEWMSATELNGNCGGISPDFATGVNAGWNLEDKAGTSIQANVNQRKGGSQPAGGSIGENHLSWVDSKGNEYFVQGASRGVSGVVAKELLLEVARSMDPTLDESKLQIGGATIDGSPPPVKPMPATR
ncbi:MAG: hypothetical protein C0506_08420 [Anaerolinea sp.]|nr:hypothetical protein [Anaerolinea sp.]